MSAQLRNPLYSPLLRRAGELRRSGAFCDAVVVVDGQAFRAHSLVLACASRELERRLTVAEDDRDHDDRRDHDDHRDHHDDHHDHHDDRHDHRRRCTIDALSAHAFRQVLDYAYAEVLEVPVADLPGLAEAARALGMEELGRQCLAWLERADPGPGAGHRGRRSSGSAGGEPQSSEASPGSTDLEGPGSPPHDSPRSREPKPDETLRRVSVIASAAPHLPAPSPTRPPKLGWGAGMSPSTTDFSIRTLQSSQPLLAYSFPFSTPVYPLFPPQTLPQVHDSIFSYARLLHPFHHSLLQAPQKLAASMKHGPLGKKASVDVALMDAVPGGGERKCQRTADRVFCCSYCHREFLDTRGLQRHEVTSSVPLEPLFCPSCGKAQTSRGALLPPHARRWGHLCSECGRSFASSTALRRHQRQHTGEATLGCEYCERCFKDESSLRSHRRIHSGEKPYQCQRCPKRFSLKHQLDTHYRARSPSSAACAASVRGTTRP
ncbi:zinc finger and BTB domain-containing protein 16 isoform X2 [Anguilla anguilla]|uniref:zinc finger and BTB domain-containing protein 16 isoform X2 n=1 Tax=Anguilla anguilla TaxID=7936 RepID=UPI0015B27DE3|nr:zinc finger and BTB domain-containing protein 16 isoform X2 [Anguilla anguilla]